MPPPAAPASGASPQDGGREWLPVVRGVRTKIVASFMALLVVAGVLSVFALHQVLVLREDDRVEDAFGQEVSELDRLIRDGRDPATGAPFMSLSALFDKFFDRNVPSDDEALLAFVDGRLYRSELSRFPVQTLPPEVVGRWSALSRADTPLRPDEDGTFGTTAGEARFRESNVAVAGEHGAFVVTIIPAAELREVDQIHTYGIIAIVLVVLAASGSVWLISGRTLGPLRELTATAHSISQSDLTRRVRVAGSGEAARMAESFNEMLDRLEGLFRSEREFLRDASHELRDPLTICLGYLEQLETAGPAERQEMVAVVTDELGRMGRIVNDLQRLAEAEQPDFLRHEEFDLALFAHELTAKAGALAARDWRLEGTAEGSIVADRHRLTEAMMNLAANAVAHTDEGAVVAIGVVSHGDTVRLWVRDEGVGVAPADAEHIFERFARGGDARRRYRGGGLGLAIVRSIAEAHGGSAELTSRPGAGATFTITLPRVPRDDALA